MPCVFSLTHRIYLPSALVLFHHTGLSSFIFFLISHSGLSSFISRFFSLIHVAFCLQFSNLFFRNGLSPTSLVDFPQQCGCLISSLVFSPLVSLLSFIFTRTWGFLSSVLVSFPSNLAVFLHLLSLFPSTAGYLHSSLVLYFNRTGLSSLIRAGIFKASMGARNRGGRGLSYRPARLHRLAEFIPWNRFRGPINV
jgi:hypothetical protein